jgi:hypothetical protein
MNLFTWDDTLKATVSTLGYTPIPLPRSSVSNMILLFVVKLFLEESHRIIFAVIEPWTFLGAQTVCYCNNIAAIEVHCRGTDDRNTWVNLSLSLYRLAYSYCGWRFLIHIGGAISLPRKYRSLSRYQWAYRKLGLYSEEFILNDWDCKIGFSPCGWTVESQESRRWSKSNAEETNSHPNLNRATHLPVQ